MPGRPIILLFVKSPVKGEVKSRLAAVLGQDAALELYRNFVLDILASVEASGIPFRICCHPPGAVARIASWLGDHHQYLPQEGADLGERMDHAFRKAFSEGVSRAVLIGSDIPDLPPALLQDAVGRLDRTGAVIGPARDGGYYLIGFRSDAFFPEIFRGPEWSSDTVFRTTLQIFERARQQVSLLTPWRDVDTIDDLYDLMNRNRSGRFISSRTMHYLSSLKGSMKSTEVSDAKVRL